MLFFFFLGCTTPFAVHGLQDLSSGVEPRPTAVKARSPNHWTAREFLSFCMLRPVLDAGDAMCPRETQTTLGSPRPARSTAGVTHRQGEVVRERGRL